MSKYTFVSDYRQLAGWSALLRLRRPHYYMQLVVAWSLINIFIAVLISAVSRGTSDDAPSLSVLVFLVFKISGFATAVGYTLCAISFPYRIPIILGSVLAAAWLAVTSCEAAIPLLFSPRSARVALAYLSGMIPNVYIITGVITLAGIYVERLRKRAAARRDADTSRETRPDPVARPAAPPTVDADPASVVIKEGANLHRFLLDDIIYLSSHGHRTTVHTKQESIVVARLLKQFEEKLPGEAFVRIHKQFTVNAAYVARLRHERGGQYRVFLNDEEASCLPVGRSYLAELRNRFPELAQASERALVSCS